MDRVDGVWRVPALGDHRRDIMKQASIILIQFPGNIKGSAYKVKQIKNSVEYDIGAFLSKEQVKAIIGSNFYDVTIIADKR